MPRVKNTINYTEPECLALCAEVQSILPLGMHGWEKVAAAYAIEAKTKGWPVRDHESLKRKFNALANTKKPTGDPTCPDSVRQAKRLQYSIETKANTGLADQDEPEPEFEGDDIDGGELGEVSNTPISNVPHVSATPVDISRISSPPRTPLTQGASTLHQIPESRPNNRVTSQISDLVGILKDSKGNSGAVGDLVGRVAALEIESRNMKDEINKVHSEGRDEIRRVQTDAREEIHRVHAEMRSDIQRTQEMAQQAMAAAEGSRIALGILKSVK